MGRRNRDAVRAWAATDPVEKQIPSYRELQQRRIILELGPKKPQYDSTEPRKIPNGDVDPTASS